MQTTLPADLEALAHETIGACLDVHKALGPGLLEAVYAKAVAAELQARGLEFALEHIIPVVYRGETICRQRVDLFIDGRLVLEVKSVDRLVPLHVAQVVSYLKLTGARIGLLVNFNVEVLRQGIRRVVL